jgi:hypothetical protein
LLATVGSLALACAGPRGEGIDAQGAGDFERDRKAILAMAGEYAVQFRFDETVALKPGYELHAPHRSGGNEFVALVEDSGKCIVLQHVLVDGQGNVVKHWRQDWEFQQALLWSYAGDYAWQRRELNADAVRGSWTQTVWQVDDSPRYAGIGRWSHERGVSAWTSEPTWRPLPRREHTTRSDYDVLVTVNRHTITPAGWVHEQFSDKLDRQGRPGEQVLAREIGVNQYRRISGYDFKAGRDYWMRTRNYWAEVRAVWAELLERNARVGLHQKVAEKTHHEALFDQAEALAGKAMTPAELRAAVNAALAPFLVLPQGLAAAGVQP